MSASEPEEQPIASLVVRSGIGGILMGLANLVPGISGGTMLLAAGVYENFVNAVAEITTLKFKKRSLLTLAAVGASAGLAILLLAGVVKGLVLDHRWIMYSWFIGLTLGGLPVVWKMAKPATTSTWVGAIFGFIGMAVLALAQQSGGAAAGGGPPGALMMFLAGIAGASAMILPGVSGGYLLLVMGVYVPLLAGIDAFKNGLKAADLGILTEVGLQTILPVGLGVLLGIAVVSNVLKWLLKNHRDATLGLLLGLLVGAVVGLWPFQQTVPPKVGDVIKGRVVTAERLSEIKTKDYPTKMFTPSGGQVGGSLALVLFGIFCTVGIAKFGEGKDKPASQTKAESQL